MRLVHIIQDLERVKGAKRGAVIILGMFIVVLCGCSVLKTNTHQFENKNELVFFDINTNSDQQTIFCDVNAKDNWSCPLISPKTPIIIREVKSERLLITQPIINKKLDNILFEFNQSDLLEIERVRLISLLPMLINSTINLHGYTDNVGDENFNNKLSMDRANHVKEFLIAIGVKAELIKTESFGECCFVASNDNDESRALNRRVEIYIEQSRLE